MTATGRAPTPSEIPLCEPCLAGNEWRYVKECLDSGWVSSVGAFVDRFEAALAGEVGVEHAVACASGTAALHLALLACGVAPGDEVLVSALTFVAPANAVRYAGAHPVFLDAEERHWQLDVAKLERFLAEECTTRNGALVDQATGRRVAAILPVSILGHPCDMDPIVAVARRHRLAVIEDATESLGAKYKGRAAGTHGDVGCYSFNGNKIVTTGGGGMLVTNDAVLARRARYLSTQAKDDPVEFVHREVGFNYRLSNVAAAMGVAQLERLADLVRAKLRIAAVYAEALGDLPGVSFLTEAPWARSSCWLTTIRLDPAHARMDRVALRAALQDRGVQTRPLWQPLHRSPAHAGARSYNVEVADCLQAQALSLPSSVGMTDAQLGAVGDAVRSLLA